MIQICQFGAGRIGRMHAENLASRAPYGYDRQLEAHGAKGMVRAENVRPSTVELADAGSEDGRRALALAGAAVESLHGGRAAAPS
jgi:hypothetical protein